MLRDECTMIDWGDLVVRDCGLVFDGLVLIEVAMVKIDDVETV